MTRFKAFLLLAVLVSTAVGGLTVSASNFYRQRYGGWSYHTSHNYYYRSYYYKPYVSYPSYNYHYCVYYPQRTNYVYYYNPYKQTYWGRYDLEKQGYSELAEKDRKAKLEDIPESAFPAPAGMPVIPDAEDGVTIEPPSTDDLPSTDTPKDVPGNNP